MSGWGWIVSALVVLCVIGLIEESIKHYIANKKWRGKE